MPRRGSNSSRSTDHTIDKSSAPKKDLKRRPLSSRERRGLVASAASEVIPEQVPFEGDENATGHDKTKETAEANLATSTWAAAKQRDRDTDVVEQHYVTDLRETVDAANNGLVGVSRKDLGLSKPSYSGTGLSDDGRSLTPEPHSSEADTVHILSENEEDHDLANYKSTILNDDEDDAAEDEEELPDVPEDLDNLSDSDAHDDTRASTPGSEILEEEESTSEMEDNETQQLGDPFRHTDQAGAPSQQAIVEASENVPDNTIAEAESDLQNPSNSLRKRKRVGERSTLNSKRLAPRKVQAELDSDEESDAQSLRNPHARNLTSEIVFEDTIARQGSPAVSQDIVHDTVPTDLALEEPPAMLEEEDDGGEEEEEEVDDEELEEEVQDDTEREERNKHRQAAMESLRQIEIEFARLRSKLYSERLTQIEREIELAETCQHPLLIEKTRQNEQRHSGRIDRAQILYESRRSEAEVQFKARKFMAHSQFAQDRQKLRAKLLSKTSAEWFQIHREKRVLDITVPEYGYIISERKSQQIKHRREREAEVSVLAGLKKSVGFPAAPSISIASTKEIESDLIEMGLIRSSTVSSRGNQALNVQHQQQQQQHAGMNNHPVLNAHQSHAHATHLTHQQNHAKNHHHRERFPLRLALADEIDHHTSSAHTHPRHTPVQNNNAELPHYHSHAFHLEPASRRTSNLSSTSFGSTPHEQDRKPNHRSLHEQNLSQEIDRDRLPFPSHTAHHSVPIYQGSAPQSLAPQYVQKQAQNLPNILRVDTPEKTQSTQNATQLTNSKGSTNSDLATPTNGKAYNGHFWSSNNSDQTTRAPAPAMSSNSAFNATLSQPGVSASYIPPKSYSPSNQPSGSLLNGNKPSSALSAIQPSGSKSFTTHGYSTNAKESSSGASPLYQPRAQQPNSLESRVLFDPLPPPKQEFHK